MQRCNIAHGCFLSRISQLNLCAHCIWQWRVPGVVLGQLRISCRVTARFHVIMHEWLQLYALHGIKVVQALLCKQRLSPPIDTAESCDGVSVQCGKHATKKLPKNSLMLNAKPRLNGLPPRKCGYTLLFERSYAVILEAALRTIMHSIANGMNMSSAAAASTYTCNKV